MQWLAVHINVTALRNLGTPVYLEGLHAGIITGQFACI